MAEDNVVKEVGDYLVTIYPQLTTAGAFGQLYEAYHQVTTEKVAVKCITFREKNGQTNKEMATMAFKEIKSIQCFKNHKHIVQFLAYHMDHYSYWIFMEFCELGHLGEYLKANTTIGLDAKVNIMQQIAAAIAFMHGHSTPLVHRDIKLENILMTREGSRDVVKVSDFGWSKLFENEVRVMAKSVIQGQWLQTLAGTQYYMAPEFFLEEETGLRYNASVDIYALGLVFSVVLKFCPEDTDTIPQSIAAQKTKKAVNIGYEMCVCYKTDATQPRVVERLDTDDVTVTELKALIDSMVQFHWAKRKPIDEVEHQLSQLVQRLSHEGDEGCSHGDEVEPDVEPDIHDEPAYTMMHNFARQRTLIDKLVEKTYTNYPDSTQEDGAQQPIDATFSKYDHVVVTSNIEHLRRFQNGYGGYHPDMKQCAGKRGMVTGTSQRGARVDMLSGQCFIFNPEALTLIGSREEPIEAGDYVIVKPEVDLVKQIQQEPGNGGWRDEMSQVIGKVGLVRYVRGRHAGVVHLNNNERFLWAMQSLVVLSKGEDMIAELLKTM